MDECIYVHIRYILYSLYYECFMCVHVNVYTYIYYIMFFNSIQFKELYLSLRVNWWHVEQLSASNTINCTTIKILNIKGKIKVKINSFFFFLFLLTFVKLKLKQMLWLVVMIKYMLSRFPVIYTYSINGNPCRTSLKTHVNLVSVSICTNPALFLLYSLISWLHYWAWAVSVKSRGRGSFLPTGFRAFHASIC